MRRWVVLVMLTACGRIGFDSHDDGGVPSALAEHTTIAAGNYFACAIKNGDVYCWGETINGQLGPGLSQPTPTATKIVGLPSTITDITAGNYHACAIDGDGGVWCWGDNDYGQAGSLPSAPVAPQKVSLIAPATAIAGGGYHTCALIKSGVGGDLWCWGKNNHGQFGVNPTSTEVLPPTHIGDGFSALSAGEYHTCGIWNGMAYCWGNNNNGQLGDNTNSEHATPVVSPGGLYASAVAAGEAYACAIVDGGAYRCWGYNGNGQLGNGTTNESDLPIAASSDRGFVSIAAGESHTCGVRADKTVACWGQNDMGEVGDNSLADRYQPTTVMGLTNVVRVANGHRFSCAMRTDGSVACWGHGATGQLANNITAELSPKKVTLPGTANVLAVGSHHACAMVGASSEIYCWGGDQYGQLGINMPAVAQATAQKVALATTPTLLGTGYHSTFVLNAANKLTGWGANYDGQLGDGSSTARHTPVAYSGTETFSDIDGGADVTCGRSGTTLSCWGGDNWGELGDGGTLGSAATAHPLPISGSAISAGTYHACAISTGLAFCWGQNYDGEVGNGREQAIETVTQVQSAVSTFASISAGGRHSCAITATGDLYCWGSNWAGQLGLGDNMERTSPMMVKSGAGKVSAGDDHTCIIATGNVVQCTGNNDYGQIGDGTTVYSDTFKTVGGLPAMMVSVAAGVGFTCALDVTGAAWCWGENSHGEVGVGTFSRRLVPIDVPL